MMADQLSKRFDYGASEREADKITEKFGDSSDVVGAMSRAFGADLSKVKVHTDWSSARKAEQENAAAYTKGSDVYMGADYRPGTREGNEVLSHELAHTMQQSAGLQDQMSAPAPQGAVQHFRWPWQKKKQKPTMGAPMAMLREAENRRVRDIKQKEQLQSLEDLPLPQARVQSGKWKGFSEAGKEHIFNAGTRQGADDILSDAGITETLAPFSDQATQLAQSIGGLGLSQDALSENQGIQGYTGTYNKESVIINKKLYQMLLPNLENPEFQAYIKDIFGNMGGNYGTTKQGEQEFFMTDTIGRIVGVVNGKRMLRSTQDTAAQQLSKQTVAPMSYFCKTISDNGYNADYEKIIPPILYPAFQAFLPVYKRVWEIGSPAIRPEVQQKIQDSKVPPVTRSTADQDEIRYVKDSIAHLRSMIESGEGGQIEQWQIGELMERLHELEGH